MPRQFNNAPIRGRFSEKKGDISYWKDQAPSWPRGGEICCWADPASEPLQSRPLPGHWNERWLNRNTFNRKVLWHNSEMIAKRQKVYYAQHILRLNGQWFLPKLCNCLSVYNWCWEIILYGLCKPNSLTSQSWKPPSIPVRCRTTDRDTTFCAAIYSLEARNVILGKGQINIYFLKICSPECSVRQVNPSKLQIFSPERAAMRIEKVVKFKNISKFSNQKKREESLLVQAWGKSVFSLTL